MARHRGRFWSSKKYLHGPRVRKPSLFKSFYTVNQAWARRRGIPIIKPLPPGARVKVGVLKRGRKLAVQSYLIPIQKVPKHIRVGKPVRSYLRRRNG